MTFENKKNITYSLIAGFPDNLVIGNGLKIPWYIPEDFKLFKQSTIDSIIIMGQLTWDSLPKKPLPKRINIVLTRKQVENEGAHTFTNLDDAFDFAAKQDKKIFVIGGASIYKQTIDKAKYLYISHIKGKFEGDILFPEFDKKDYKIIEKKEFEDFTFCKYEKL
ncbi:MAG: dihydrofolate reductase [Nanoarchaeales archaeon]|nr:dihydrofolate reductase [Nanoarchaeales archaeon]